MGLVKYSVSYIKGFTLSCTSPDIYFDVATQLCYGSCPPGSILVGTRCELAPCSAGAFRIPGRAACEPCAPLCGTCASSSSCSSCVLDSQFDQGRVFCLCRSLFYQQDRACLPCPAPCLSCSAGRCSACLGSLQLLDSTCGCFGNSYQVNSACALCPPSCASCAGSGTCTACPTGYSLAEFSCVLIVTATHKFSIYGGSL